MTTLEHTPLTRTVDGTEVPAAGTYSIDASHTEVGLQSSAPDGVQDQGPLRQRQRHRQPFAEGLRPSRPSRSRIDAALIDTRDAGARRRASARADFLDVEAHPTITYRGDLQCDLRGPAGQVEGELPVRGVTLSGPSDRHVRGRRHLPVGRRLIGFTARADPDREDFGLTWNRALETGGVLVGEQVRIDVEAEENAASSPRPVDRGWGNPPQFTGCSPSGPQAGLPRLDIRAGGRGVLDPEWW